MVDWSEDAVTWHVVRDTGDAVHWRMIFAKDRFVAVGDANNEGRRRKWSADGVLWKDYQQGGDAFWNIAYGNNHFVAVGPRNLRARSLDRVKWESRTDSGNLGDFSAIAFGDGKFIAFTYINCVSSSDGDTWSAPLRQTPGGTYGSGFGLGTSMIVTDKIHASKTLTTWSPVESTKGASLAHVGFGYLN